MPTYNSQTTRTDIGALIPEEVLREIIQGVPEESAVMRLARRLPNVSRAQQRMPVLTALPIAYFQASDTALKQTTEMAWDSKYINIEELAVIVPIPQNVLDDADYDLWAEIRPRIISAMGKAFDQAVLFGTNAPTSWPDDIVTAATAAGNDESLAAFTDLYDAILGDGGLLQDVELDGYVPNGNIGAIRMKGLLRGVRDANGQPIFEQYVNGTTNQNDMLYTVAGLPTYFPRNGSIDATQALFFTGDWDQVVWAMRTDLTMEVFREGVISDGAGAIVYNLMQQDMVALRAVMRLGWQVPNPINYLQSTEANRYPVAVLKP